MGDQRNGGIAWTEETWNPVRGCSKKSEGCRNCYAESMAARFCAPGQPYDGLVKDGRWNGEVKMVAEHLNDPLHWRRPRRVFVNSMSDLFHENLADEDIDQIFARMAMAPQHTFQVLTKRADRMVEYLKKLDPERIYNSSLDKHGVSSLPLITGHHLHWKLTGKVEGGVQEESMERLYGAAVEWPLPNVWLGVTVENQDAAEERIPLLLEAPAAVRWISMEPLLGPVDLDLPRCEIHGRDELSMDGRYCNECAADGFSGELAHGCWLDPLNDGVAWVVVGGESGSHARPMHSAWVRSLRDQCHERGVPFLFKQWGEWLPDYQRDFRIGTGTLHPAPAWGLVKPNGAFRQVIAAGQKRDVSQDPTWGEGEDGTARVGKQASGRLLDGQLHNAYPGVDDPETSHA